MLSDGAGLQLLLLGPTDLRNGDASLPIGGLKARSVLAMLGLAEGRVLPVETLIDGIWGEEPPSGAGNALQYHVSVLRKSLASANADDVLQTRPPGYLLAVPTDVARFAQARADARRLAEEGRPEDAGKSYERALACWRGPALADLTQLPFAAAKAQALESARLSAVESAVDLELAAGRAEEWVSALEELVAEHPTRERLWAQLMTALYRTGRQASALEAYARARLLLDEELGVEPSPELRDLQARVLAQDPSLNAAPQRPGRRNDGPSARRPGGGPISSAGSGVSVLATRMRSHRHSPAGVLVLPDGRRVKLADQPVVIGRHPDCDVVLDDLDVSRQHLRIEPAAGGGHMAIDLGSTNGSSLNGAPLHASAALDDGDRLEIGDSVLRYEAAPPTTAD